MKQLLFIALITATCLTACTKEAGPGLAPVLIYEDSIFLTSFHSAGNSYEPVLDWNGSLGTLSLVTEEEALSLDPVSGVVSWGKDLPLHTSYATVIATNDYGQATEDLRFHSFFWGHFTGNYTNDPNDQNVSGSSFELTFSPTHHSIIVNDGGLSGEGEWGSYGDTITAVYCFTNCDAYFTIRGVLQNDESEATLSGYWYEGPMVSAGNEAGYFRVSKQ